MSEFDESLSRSIKQNADVWQELAMDTARSTYFFDTTAIPSTYPVDTPVEVLKTQTVYVYFDEHGRRMERDEPLPKPPVCFLCGEPHVGLDLLGFYSKYDEEWICPGCNDEAIRLLVTKRAKDRPHSTKTTKRYRRIEDDD